MTITTEFQANGVTIMNNSSSEVTIALLYFNTLALPNGVTVAPGPGFYWQITARSNAVLEGAHGPLRMRPSSSASFEKASL